MRMTIGRRLGLGFGILVLITVGVGLYSLRHLAEINRLTATISDHDVHVLELVRQIGAGRDDMTIQRQRDLLERLRNGRSGSAEPQGEWISTVRRTQGLLDELAASVAEYQSVVISPERHLRWQKIASLVSAARTQLDQRVHVVETALSVESNGGASATATLDSGGQANATFDTKIAELEAITDEIVRLGKAASATSYEQTRNAVLLALLAAVVLGGGLGVAIYRSITRPLSVFVTAVEKIGRGDLTQEVPVVGDDELSTFGRSLNEMVAGLRGVAEQTRAATEDLSSAAAEILASTQQQVAGTGEQAAAVQQTTATVNEISQSGEQISQQAKQVATAAEATVSASKAGGKAVQDIAVAMAGIREQAEAVAENIVALSERTQAVGEIIATVTDIAEQTNLLALNAAIEAAAAGEQGRSFAVVAVKLNGLADQSKEATVQVRSILGEIQKGINTSVMLTEEAVKRVESGDERAGVAGATISEMAGSIEDSVHAFQQIVAATNQQQIGFDQVAEALQNIAQATNQTAASTRQLEKAAASLNELGQQLKQNVARYRV